MAKFSVLEPDRGPISSCPSKVAIAVRSASFQANRAGMIAISSITDDFYLFDAARMRLTGRRNRKCFKIGDKLRVSIARVDAYKQQRDLVIVG